MIVADSQFTVAGGCRTIAIRTTTTLGKIHACLVVRTAGLFFFAGRTARTTVTNQTLPAIGSIGKWFVAASVFFAGDRVACAGGAIVDGATTTIGEIDAGIIVWTTGRAWRAECGADTRLASETITAISSVRKEFVNAGVRLACTRIAYITGTIGVGAATTAIWIVAGIATGTAEGSLRTTRSTRVRWTDLRNGTALFFGDAHRADIATGVIAALFGSVAAIGSTFESGWAHTILAVPNLHARATDRFGSWFGTPGGFGMRSWQNRCSRGANAQQTLEQRTAAAAAGEGFGQSVETPVVHGRFPGQIESRSREW